MNISTKMLNYSIEDDAVSKTRRLSFTVHAEVDGLGQSFQFLIPYPTSISPEDRDGLHQAIVTHASDILDAASKALGAKSD